MPGFDRTGPEGEGSRTGRGMGKCNPKNNVTDDTLQGRGQGRGRGFGRARGGGFGHRHGYGHGGGSGQK